MPEAQTALGQAGEPRLSPSPVSEMLQFKDVHRLRVTGSTQELGIHAEYQGADVHVPRAKETWAGHLLARYRMGPAGFCSKKRTGRRETHIEGEAPCLAAAEAASPQQLKLLELQRPERTSKELDGPGAGGISSVQAQQGQGMSGMSGRVLAGV